MLYRFLMLAFIPLCVCGCTSGKFGRLCTYSCHCKVPCDATGYCNGGCLTPWTGPTCQMYNLAFNKSADQEDDYLESKRPASYAVDGNRNGELNENGTCIHTAEKDTGAWWRVNLGDIYAIKSVRIYDRIDGIKKQRITGYSIHVSNNTDQLDFGSLCYKRAAELPYDSLHRVYHQNCSVTGQTVTISIPARTDSILDFCEVEVYNCSTRTYGDNCEHQCGYCRNNDFCNQTDGVCPNGCQSGWHGDTCQACMRGKFGRNCSETCLNCLNDTCHPINGVCDECIPGMKGENCSTECSNKTYGVNCRGTCGHCFSGESCDRVTGHCRNGCDPGYRNDFCNQTCQAGQFGRNCSKSCLNCENRSCDPVTGSCIICVAGMEKEQCATLKTSTEEQNDYMRSTDSKEAAITGSVTASCIAVLFIILVVCVVKRREKGNTKLESTIRNEMDPNIPNNGNMNIHYQIPRVLDTWLVSHMRQEIFTNFGTPDLAPNTGIYVFFAEVFVNNSYVNDICVIDTGATQDDNDDFHQEEEGAYANVNKERFAIAIDQLKDFVEDKLKTDALDKEFEDITSGPRFSCSEGEKRINKEKNRFKAKYPYNHCRVELPTEQGQGNTGYINASYIDSMTKKRCYIATQGPKKTTIWDFWTMVWTQNTGIIVMLTGLKEGNTVKCEKYWPDIEEPLISDNYKVSCIEEQEHSAYVIRFIHLFNIKTKETRLVQHWHFTKWPDHGVPDCFQLLAFHQHIQRVRTARTGPMIVHCSAGIGRTGTFIGLDALLESGAKTGEVSIRSYVEQMRNNRMDMVQTDTQYTFLHQVLGESFAVQNPSVHKDDFIKTRIDGSFDHAVEEYKKLMAMKKRYRQEEYEDAFLIENANKHRSQLFVPADAHRPCLSSYISGKNDYINAVLLPNCCRNVGFIATQQPLNHTVCDFWRLILDHASSTIICLQSPKENETYWPSNGEAMSFDSRLTVSQVEESDDENGYSIHKFNICYQSSIGESKDVTMYELSLSFWLDDDVVPCDISPLLQLEDVVYGIQRRDNTGVITLQCLDGATRCGLVCAIFNVMQRMRMDGDVNIYHAVRQLQIRHPQFVNSQKQYIYLYEAVKEYIISSSTYAN